MWLTRQYAARIRVAAVGAALAGCSVSEFVQDLTPPPAANLSQPNHRRLVADNIKTGSQIKTISVSWKSPGCGRSIISRGRPGSPASSLMRTEPPALCYLHPGNKIVDTRAGIVIDQCHKQTYTPLDR